MSDLTRIEELFHAALEHSTPEQRVAYLRQVCADDSERQAVERLLSAHQQADNFLGELPATLLPTEDHVAESVDDLVGTTIGPYRLLEVIGEGGMGIVYMAEQLAPIKRRVALKVIKPGLDTRQVIARFEAERQALAMMDHPNIARVLDAGATASGRPYFVMELVRGVPITQYCDVNQLTLNARLDLFTQVCHAVQHAHLKGIIHRDLKPTNVLVTLHDGRPVPKVIDFGVAKAVNQQLTEKTLFTNFAAMVGTPLYMSPEQAEMSGLDIDTRTDIYSLGVLLYELLTGTTPFDRDTFRQASYDEIRRIIREKEPVRPSTRISGTESQRTPLASYGKITAVDLSRRVQGDLDWIVMKALEKDRGRRYETASGFAHDITRYLADQPVEAGPPSTLYRLRKFARRNRIALISVSLFMTVLLGATAVSSWQAIRATRAERRADEQARQALQRGEKAQEERRRADGYAREAEKRAAEAASAQQMAEQRSRELEIAVRQEREQSLRNYKLRYVSDIQNAQRALESRDIKRTVALLEPYEQPEFDEDIRGWEWHYLNRQCHGELRCIEASQGPLRAIAAHPDGIRVASGGSDGSVKVWNTITGAAELEFKAHPDRIVHVAYSPSGALLATVGADRFLMVWDAQSGERRWSRQVSVWCSPQFSKDNQQLLLLSQSRETTALVVMAVASGELVRETPLQLPARLWRPMWWLSGDARFAVVADGQVISQPIYLLDLVTARVTPSNKVHNASITTAVFSPDGRTCATSSDPDGAIKFWDTATGRELRSFTSPAGACLKLAYSPDGTRLASAIGSTLGLASVGIQVWDLDRGTVERTLLGHTDRIADLSLNLHGNRVFSASVDGTVRVWGTQGDGDTTDLTSYGVRMHQARLSSDGRRLAVPCQDNKILIWDVESRCMRSVLPAVFLSSMALSPDGSRLAVASNDGNLSLWDVDSRRKQFSILIGYPPQGRPRPSNPLREPTIHFVADGAHVLVTGNSGGMKLLNAHDGAEVWSYSISTPQLARSCVDISPDSRWIACGRWDGIALHDGKTGKLIRVLTQAFRDLAHGVAFSSDSRYLSWSNHDATVAVWDMTSDALAATLVGHATPPQRLQFVPNTQRLVSAAYDDTLILWDIQSATQMLTIRRVGERYTNLACGAAGQKLVCIVDNRIVELDAGTESDDEKTTREIVQELYCDGSFTADVLGRIKNDLTFPANLAEQLVRVARRYDRTPERRLDCFWALLDSGLGANASLSNQVQSAEGLCSRFPGDARYSRLLAAGRVREGRYAEARDLLSNLNDHHPSTMALNLAVSLSVHDEPAAVDLTHQLTAHKAWSSTPEDAEDLTLHSLVRDQFYVAAQRQHQGQDWDGVIRILSLASKLFSRQSREDSLLVDAYAMSGRWDDAATTLAESVADHESLSTLCDLAGLELAAGRESRYRELMSRIFARSAQIRDNAMAVRIALGASLGELEAADVEAALTLARLAVASDPQSPIYLTALGIALLRRGESDDAVATLRKALLVHGWASAFWGDTTVATAVSQLNAETMLAVAHHRRGESDALVHRLASLKRHSDRLTESPPKHISQLPIWIVPLAQLISQRELAKIEQ